MSECLASRAPCRSTGQGAGALPDIRPRSRAPARRREPDRSTRAWRSSTTSRPTSSRPAGFATTTTRRSRGTAWSACAAASSQSDAIKNGGFGVIVSGISKGCGQLARDGALQRARGGRPARHRARASRRSTGRTRRTSACSPRTDFGLLERIERGEAIPIAEFTRGPRSDQRRRSSSTAGSSPTTSARLAGEVAPPADHDAAAADDALREDHRRARRSSTPKPASSASPR